MLLLLFYCTSCGGDSLVFFFFDDEKFARDRLLMKRITRVTVVFGGLYNFVGYNRVWIFKRVIYARYTMMVITMIIIIIIYAARERESIYFRIWIILSQCLNSAADNCRIYEDYTLNEDRLTLCVWNWMLIPYTEVYDKRILMPQNNSYILITLIPRRKETRICYIYIYIYTIPIHRQIGINRSPHIYTLYTPR